MAGGVLGAWQVPERIQDASTPCTPESGLMLAESDSTLLNADSPGSVVGRRREATPHGGHLWRALSAFPCNRRASRTHGGDSDA